VESETWLYVKRPAQVDEPWPNCIGLGQASTTLLQELQHSTRRATTCYLQGEGEEGGTFCDLDI
jgi:hypothetical protein